MFLDDDEVSAATAGAAVPAEALELFNSLGYTFVGVALGLFVFLLVRKFLFFLTWRSFRDGPYVPGVHQWRPGNIAGPQWCNVCESIVYGIRSYVVKCDICGMYAHAQCAAATVRFKGVRVARAASRASCRCKFPGVVVDLADDREPEPLATGEHMWVQGNIDPMDTCSVCGLFCGSLLALSGLKCAWCHVRVHDECFQAFVRSHKRAGALLRHCDFGRHANLILPPSSVRLRAPPSFSTTSQRALSSVRSAAQKAVTKMSKIRLRRSLPSGGGADDTLAAPASTGSTSSTNNPRRVSYSPVSPPASAPLVTAFAEPEKPPSKREEADSELPFDVVAPPGDKTPLLVFINSRSGGQMGLHVLRQARRWLNPVQVFDLAHQSPVAPLRLFANIPRLRVLVCGGDGTVGWVLGALDELGAKRPPPVAVLPLGTGNDLARVLGWGSGFSSRESDLSDVLAEVEAAHVSLLDRWRVAIDDKPRAVLNNYLGVGVDAQVALEFHEQRERSPGLFMSQFVNKLWYSQFGAKNFLVRTCAGLPRKMELVCDGVHVRLPEGTEGVIVLNINSYGGGSKLWHDADSDGESVDGDDTEDDGSLSDSARSVGSSNGGGVGLGPSSPHDGLLDVVAVYGTLHLGQLQVGLSRAVRLCQARSVSIRLKETLPVQIDGEPWLQPPSDVDIGFMQQSFMLSRTVQERDVVTKKVGEVLDWAEHARVISARQRDVLLAEIARRVADDNTSGLTKRLRRDNGSLLLAD